MVDGARRGIARGRVVGTGARAVGTGAWVVVGVVVVGGFEEPGQDGVGYGVGAEWVDEVAHAVR